MDTYEAINRRISVRSYQNTLLEEEVLRSIEEQMKSLIPLNDGVCYRLELVKGMSLVQSFMKGFVGSYGRIDAPYCIAAITEKTPGSMENIGFLQEQLVLKLTALGLGTCWVAGIIDRKVLRSLFSVNENETVPNVIPFGFPKEGFYNKGFRKLIGAHKRKAAGEIAFLGRWGADITETMEDHPPIKRMIEASVKAPSAMNKQPSRLILEGRKAMIFSKCRQEDDQSVSRLDAGIFAAHFYMAGLAEGFKPQISLRQADRKKYGVPDEYSFIVSIDF